MKKEYQKLPYRNNVGIIVFKKDKFLLVQLKEWNQNFWKFPQGGCEKNEKPNETAMREFEEELGSKKISIKFQSKYEHIYDFPDDKIRLLNERWKGQKQKFLVAEFRGNNDEIKINQDEIKKYKWCSKKELKENILHEDPIFKGYYDFISKVLKEFNF